MNLGFDRAYLAVAAIIIIPLACYFFSKLRNPFVALIPLGAPGGVPFKVSQVSVLVKLLKTIEFAGVFLLFISAAGPSVNTAETVFLNRGADIIFVLDTSPSMASLDMDGKSRFLVARNLLSDFALRRATDNIGLAAVGEDAALLVPPTADRDALLTRLESLRLGEMGDGTALGMGLAIAAFHLEKSNAKRRVVVLLTDGENNAGAIHPETAASMLGEMGVSLWIIGIGTGGEVPIDYTDPYTLVRSTGLYDSRYDTERLRLLALSADGNYISAPSADAFTAAFAKLNESEITVQRSKVINRRHSISLHFLLIAVSLLAAVRIVRRNLLGAII